MYCGPDAALKFIGRPCREPFNSTPMAANSLSFGDFVRRFRSALRTYDPWGCIVRVVSQTKSKKSPPEKYHPLFFVARR